MSDRQSVYVHPVEDEFEELFREVWNAYPGMVQDMDMQNGVDDVGILVEQPQSGPSPANGHAIPATPLGSRSSRAFRPLPVPPTPQSLSRTPSTDPLNETARRLPPAPTTQSPQSALLEADPVVSQLWNSTYPRPIDEETSSIYPAWDAPALPLYVKEESPPPLLPAPPYDHPQNGLLTESAVLSLNLPAASSPTDAMERREDSERLLHRPPSIYGLEVVQVADPVYDQLSPSDLSYVDSPVGPRSRSRTPSIIENPPSPSQSSHTLAAPKTVHRVEPSPRSPSNLTPELDQSLQAGPSQLTRQMTDILRDISGRAPLTLHYDCEEEFQGRAEEDVDNWFVNLAFLSHLAVHLRDKVPRTTHVKGGVSYPYAFTGKDVVTTIHSLILRELTSEHGGSPTDRRAALHIARSLHSQFFFCEVEWGAREVQDGVEDLYMFMDDLEGGSNSPREALPTSIVTVMTTCYSSSCGEGPRCYAYGCPRKGDSLKRLLPKVMEAPSADTTGAWSKNISPEILRSLSESEINRQTLINKLVSKEGLFVQDLDFVESTFIRPLRSAKPPVITPIQELEDFIENVFSNMHAILECNRRLLEILYVRQREQAPVVQGIGDILLEAATEFRHSYPPYLGNLPLAERRLREELESNLEFRMFVDKWSRQQASRSRSAPRLDLRNLLHRPSEHVQKYPFLLKAILDETNRASPDGDYLSEAIEAIKNLRDMVQLRTFQSAMGKGPTGRLEWQELLSVDLLRGFTSDEIRRQAAIFGLIKGEMLYIRNLETLESIYLRPLRKSMPPVIPPERLERFLKDVFYNFAELHAHHLRLVDRLHTIQFDEHPQIRSITAAILDAALNFRDAYLEYLPNYPVASYRIDEEVSVNPTFREFVQDSARHQDANGMTMKDFLNCPIVRILEYERVLTDICNSTKRDHPDRNEIPQVIEILRDLGRETEPGVASSKQKVQLWQYNANLVFKPGEVVDLDLLSENRSLIHTGKLYRQSDNSSDASKELFVILFDNYLVMTKSEHQAGATQYIVIHRPVPLDLLILVNFTDRPKRRGPSRGHRSGASSPSTSSNSGGHQENGDSRMLYPFTIHHNSRLGGFHVLCAESSHGRNEWKLKLEEALGLRRVVQESNKVFEIETLSMHTFSMLPGSPPPSPSPLFNINEGMVTGKITCSVPFNTQDGRKLVAIGCAEGVWIGFRHDSTSLRRVLHLRLVTQCAMLDDFGLFLVLSEKQLFAYHIEALAPTPHQISTTSHAPQKVSGNRDVSFFSVGKILDRTYVVYMRKKGPDSCFHVLEPILEKIYDRPKVATGMFGFLNPVKTDWFKTTKDFRLSSDAFDMVFLKSRVAILSTNGFEIMSLNENKSIVIPNSDPCLEPLVPRYEKSRPIGIFKTGEDGFLLCYTHFGIYVDKQGLPNRHATHVEWEGTANTAAFHAPYILLFDSKFIEIRHVDTGRLAQIIPGMDVNCVWDGRSVMASGAAFPGAQSDDEMAQDAHVHAVVSMPEHSSAVGRPPRPVVQHVFELIPTIPLYLPGSLASPADATYFASFSPPRSPERNPSPLHM